MNPSGAFVISCEMDKLLRISAYALLLDEGRILLCRLSPHISATQEWTLPGGGIDIGEHPRDAAVREVFEECGLHISVSREATIDSESVEYSGRLMQALRLIFRGRILGGELRYEIDGSTDQCAWFSHEEAQRLPLVGLARLGLQLAFADTTL